jgi:CDP-glucose 4,6-dehydratase
MTGRRILITGASGFTGSWLTERLLDEGGQIIALLFDMHPDSIFVRKGLISRVKEVQGSVLDKELLIRTIAENHIDSVFHLAAISIEGSAYSRPFESFEVNIRGTYNLLEACRENSKMIDRVIIASSDKVYGDTSVLPYTEDIPVQGLNPYDASKSCADLLTRCYHECYGIPVTLARFANIYGGGDLNWSRLIPNSIRRLLSHDQPVINVPINDVYKRDFLFIRDQVEAYLTLFDKMGKKDIQGRAYNFGMGSCLMVSDVVEKIKDLLNLSHVKNIERVVCHREILHQQLSIVRAETELGWKPKYTIDQGLAETVEWYRWFLRFQC